MRWYSDRRFLRCLQRPDQSARTALREDYRCAISGFFRQVLHTFVAESEYEIIPVAGLVFSCLSTLRTQLWNSICIHDRCGYGLCFHPGISFMGWRTVFSFLSLGRRMVSCGCLHLPERLADVNVRIVGGENNLLMSLPLASTSTLQSVS